MKMPSTLDRCLAELSPDQIRTLLIEVLQHHPELMGWAETRAVALLARATRAATEAGTIPPAIPPPDAEAIRHRVRSALGGSRRGRRYEDFRQTSQDAISTVWEVLGDARARIEAGDGRNALRIIEAATEEYLSGWTALYDDEGETGEVFKDLGESWTEAILSADLTPAERVAWEKRLSAWKDELDEYDVGDTFEIARAAAQQGWDDPALLRVLRGEITSREAWRDEAPDYADELAVVRLDALERQGRFQEYLYLAEVEGQTERYATMLVRLGRTQEALEFGQKHLTTPAQALALAKALYDSGAREEGLRTAERGLELPKDAGDGEASPGNVWEENRHRAALARWLRDEAGALGQTDRALTAGRIAMNTSPSLADYQALQTVAGDGWPSLREELLDGLRRRKSHYASDEIDIFLHEGLIDDAITALRGDTHSYLLIEKVADAALQSRPDWVIRASRAQAESIMDAGKSTAYHHAIRWLEKVRAAYRAAERDAEWQAYLEQLLAKHTRKYSLVPQLRQLL